MGRSGSAHQDRADSGALGAGDLEHVEQDVGCVQVRADQDVGCAAQAAVRQRGAANGLRQGSIAMHFAIAFDVRCCLHKQVARIAHLARRFARRRAVVGMRQKSHLGWHAKALHFLGCHQGDGSQLGGIGVFIDVGVGNEQRVLFQHQGVHGGQLGGAGLQTDDVADVLQVAVEFAHQAADHGIGIAQVHHQRGDQRIGAAHCRLGGFRRDAFAAHDALVGFPVLAKARVVFRVAHFHVLAQAHAQVGFGNSVVDHGWATNENGLGQAIVDRALHGAQHALVFAFGIGHALLCQLGGVEHRTHEHTGLVHKAGQAFAVGGNVLDGPRGNARLGRCLGHCRGNAQDQAGVKGRRNQVVGAEMKVFARIGRSDFIAEAGFGQFGDLAHAGQLHGLGDLGGAAVQCAPEDVREAQDIVDLVRVVRAAGGHDAVRACCLGQFGTDLWLGVGERQNDWLVAHGHEHVHGQHARG